MKRSVIIYDNLYKLGSKIKRDQFVFCKRFRNFQYVIFPSVPVQGISENFGAKLGKKIKLFPMLI